MMGSAPCEVHPTLSELMVSHVLTFKDIILLMHVFLSPEDPPTVSLVY